MKLFRRRNNEGHGGAERAASDTDPTIDLTASVDRDILEIEAQVQANNDELDSIEARLEQLRSQSAELGAIDLTKSEKRGIVESVDLTALMSLRDARVDEGFDRWFDTAFADVDED